MKKIYLCTSNVQPVPAVNGGATETLLTILIEENERAKKAKLYIYCAYNKEAENIARGYRFTEVIFYKNLIDRSIISILLDKFIYKYIVNLLLWKIGFLRGEKPLRYYLYAYENAKKIEPDYIVAEGGLYEQYQIFLRHFPRERLYAHLHRQVLGNDKIFSIFGNVIAVSGFIANKYKNEMNCMARVRTIYNCCDNISMSKQPNIEELDCLRDLYDIKIDDFVVIYSGRIVEEKGVIELIEAVIGINIESIKLIILGSSFYKNGNPTRYVEMVERKVSESGGRVKIAGYVDNSDLYKYFSLASLCVVPSLYEEPLSLVPLEAMTAGIPVVISDSGGMQEFDKEGCLLVVSRKNNFVEGLSAKILKVYENPELATLLIERGRKRADEFSRARYYSEICSLFEL